MYQKIALILGFVLLFKINISSQYLKIEKADSNTKTTASQSDDREGASTTPISLTENDITLSTTSDTTNDEHNYDIDDILGEIDDQTTTISSKKTTTSTERTTTTTTTGSSVSAGSRPDVKKPNRNKNIELKDGQKGAVKGLRPENYYCECDLRTDYCDINCCCDFDCTGEMLKVFDCFKIDENDLEEDEADHGFLSCSKSNSWFCIAKENTKPESEKKYNPELYNRKKFYEWTSPLFDSEDEVEDGQTYRYEQPLKIFSEQEDEIFDLEMPYAFMGDFCNIFEPVRHLIDHEHSCILEIEDYDKFVKDMQDKLTKSFILKSRKEIPELDAEHCSNEKYFEYCSKLNVFACTRIELNDSLVNCTQAVNTTIFEEYEIWDGIEINVQHNYTHLNNTDVFFYVTKDLDLSKTNESFDFQINIRFFTLNETKNSIVPPVGGPLGYKTGLPVIKSRMILLNESAEESERVWVFDYFHPNKSMLNVKNTLDLMTSFDGICEKRDDKELLNYEVHSMAICNVNLSDTFPQLKSSSNFENICNVLQSTVFEHLLDIKNISTTYELFISELGNPKNNSKYWKKIELKNFEPIQITGQYNKRRNTFSCKNIILGVKTGFLTAELTVNDVKNQNLIKSAFYEFEPRVNLEFKLDEPITFPIYSAVMFYDVTDCGQTLSFNRLSMLVILLCISLS